MEELRVTAQDVTVRLTCDEVDLFLTALNELLELLVDWEFATRTGFEKSEFRALLEELRAIRGKIG
ncbi:MAG: hypothetical protein EYC70_01130 [Planctomycetota bacterium]|nr:MAG: hypothetical protein EYC70_01130 [Planctomycetota bacterium]